MSYQNSMNSYDINSNHQLLDCVDYMLSCRLYVCIRVSLFNLRTRDFKSER